MEQLNIFTSTAAVCRFFFGRNQGVRQDNFPYWMTPAAGLLSGLFFAVLSAAFVFLMGPVAGGILTAVFIPLALELFTGWRGLIISVACFEAVISGNKNLLNPLEKKGEKTQTELMQRQILFATFYIFRMVVFGILAASGNAVWFVYVLGGAYLIRGELLKEDDFDAPAYGNWLMYVMFSLVTAVLAFHWSALASFPLALVLTVLCLLGSRRIAETLSDRKEFWIAELLGYLSENIMLIVGLALFGRFIHG